MVRERPAYRFNGLLPAALEPLRNESVWVCWNFVWREKPGGAGKWQKPPHSATTGRMEKAWTTVQNFVGTFEQAVATMRRHDLAGVGISLGHAGLCGVDLDDAITDSDTFTPLLAELAADPETYGEISPSGEGVHFLAAKSDMTIKRDDLKIEVYHAGRFFTFTGNALENAPDAIRPAPRLLSRLSQIDRETPKPGKAALPQSIAAPALVRPTDAGDYFANVNAAAMANLDRWVRVLHPTARKHATGAWRVTSRSLGRDLEEDLAYHPDGIRDHGEERGMSPIDAVLRYGGAASPLDAAAWLCHRMGLEPAALGLRKGTSQRPNPPPPAPRAPEPQKPAPALPTALPDLVDGDDDETIPPREWLLGTSFCKEFVSAIIAPGATGKTALRIAQLMSLATGVSLTDEHVHRRVPILWVSLEDNEREMRRRIRACRLHNRISPDDLRGWFFRMTLARSGAKLVVQGEHGHTPGPLADAIRRIVAQKRVEIVSFDPFVKAHTADENDNKAVDEVMQVLVALADELGIAVDTTHHARKGVADAGDADIGRGASSMRDALRLGKTLTPMSREEAREFDIKEAERRKYVRYDDAKANLAPTDLTQWFRLVGVALGNGTAAYPNGDNVQTVEPWTPPSVWAGISNALANEILEAIDAGPEVGERYTDHGKSARAAWRVVMAHVPDKTDEQARAIVRTWVRNGVLERREYDSPGSRSVAKGLFLNHVRRPS